MINRITCIIVLLSVMNSSYAVNNISILGLFKDKALVRLDGKQRLLSIGEASPEGVILISSNSEEAVVEINGIRKTYTLDSGISDTFSGPSGQRTVTIAPDQQGMYWVNGSINNFQVKFIVETGATLISMNRNHARRIGLDYLSKGEKSTSTTASGIEVVYIVRLDKVKVGEIQFNDIHASIHDSEFPPVILLGNSFLNRVNMKREDGLLLLLDR